MARIIEGRLIVGRDKAAALMLALQPDKVAKIFSYFNEEEIRQICLSMTNLGLIEASSVEYVIQEFTNMMLRGAGVMGSFDNTKRLLQQFLDPEQINSILSGMKGATVGMWERLAHVNEDTLANFLKNEHPQTVAVILSKIETEHAARILTHFSEELAVDIMLRMLTTTTIKRDVLEEVERSLKVEFMDDLTRTSRYVNPYETLAEIFNSFDRSTEKRLMTNLENSNAEAAEKVKSLMFTFADFIRIDKSGIQILIREADKSVLAMALKGASEPIKELFFTNMSERAGKLLKEDIAAFGMVRVRDVDEAQAKMVALSKQLSDSGEISILDNTSSDEMIG